MATSLQRTVDRAMLARTGALVGVCTAVLTAAFVGVVALASGRATGVGSRLQFYILAGAVVFVGSLLVLEESKYEGTTVILGAVGSGIAGLVIVGLGSEGVRYALARPDTVLSSSLLVYLVAAALVASGLGYWSVRNWRLLGQRMPNNGL
jgi:hypothetical protein